MRISTLFFFLSFSLFLISCSDSDSDPVSPEEKTYDVEYRITGTATVSQVRYLSQSGDTLSAINVNSGWSHKWPNKGKSGNQTFLGVTLVNTSDFTIMEILANNTILESDTIEGWANATITYSVGRTLPY